MASDHSPATTSGGCLGHWCSCPGSLRLSLSHEQSPSPSKRELQVVPLLCWAFPEVFLRVSMSMSPLTCRLHPESGRTSAPKGNLFLSDPLLPWATRSQCLSLTSHPERGALWPGFSQRSPPGLSPSTPEIVRVPFHMLSGTVSDSDQPSSTPPRGPAGDTGPSDGTSWWALCFEFCRRGRYLNEQSFHFVQLPKTYFSSVSEVSKTA